jgi:hypothetical protein
MVTVDCDGMTITIYVHLMSSINKEGTRFLIDDPTNEEWSPCVIFGNQVTRNLKRPNPRKAKHERDSRYTRSRQEATGDAGHMGIVPLDESKMQ